MRTEMTKRLAVICAGLMLLISTGLRNARADDGQRLVDVTVSILTSGCDAQYRANLAYSLLRDVEAPEHALLVRENVSGIRRIDVRLSPGRYAITVGPSSRIARTKSNYRDLDNCISSFGFTVIPDHPRHLAAVLGVNKSQHANCSVAGALPVEGLGVSLVHPTEPPSSAPESRYFWWNSPGRPVEVDGAAYYIEHVLPLHYKLVIHDFASDIDAEIPLDLTQQFSADSLRHCGGSFVRSITKEELQQLFPAGPRPIE